MLCDCGGVLVVIAIEDIPKHLSSKEKIMYNRVCDVQCQKCDKIQYSQPYDDGNLLNLVKETKKI
ncbi:hypothetical protein [Evansella cellulosilytica]|uniref:Uncharacterized protein n=1 Tax=Evansella cellulosilytica (strain ATCC 21833 / DSM 2522 / FERM P-1141 / JCM 9156 / N-4) TaxID=649639 RepID=E6TU28_EVAC2|nr:hypothetical protein [Evansella cellulosilytica]ADU28488.1 hypothetical protein Bcell_0199 [Evansella cellulosilytica DSM 2522]